MNWYTLSDGKEYRIIDGDTIADRANKRYRIGGIDTYEIDHGIEGGDFGSKQGEVQRQILESLIKNKKFSNINFTGEFDKRGDTGAAREIISLGNDSGGDVVNTMYYEGLAPLRGRNFTEEGQLAYKQGTINRIVNGRRKDEYFDNLRNDLAIASVGDDSFIKQPAINEAYFDPKVNKGVHFRHSDRDMYNQAHSPLKSSFGGGIDSMQAGLYGVLEMTGHKFDIDYLKSAGEAGVLHNMAAEAEMPEWVNNIEDVNSIGDFADWAAGSLGGSLPYFGLMAAGFLPVPGMAQLSWGSMALIYAGQTWNEMEGAPDKKSMGVALTAGILQSMFERLGGKIVFGNSATPKMLSSKKGIREAINKLSVQQRDPATGRFIKKNITNAEARRLLNEAREAEIVATLKQFNQNKVVWGAWAQTVRDKALSGMVGESLTEGAQESTQYIGAWLGSEEGKKKFDLDEFRSRIINATAAGGLLGAGVRGGGGVLTTPNPYDVNVRQVAHDRLKNIYGKYVVTDPESREAILDEASRKYISPENFKGNTGNPDSPYVPKETDFIHEVIDGVQTEVQVTKVDPKTGEVLKVLNPVTGKPIGYKAFLKQIGANSNVKKKVKNIDNKDPDKEYEVVYDIDGNGYEVEVTLRKGDAFKIKDPITGKERIADSEYMSANPLDEEYVLQTRKADGKDIKVKDIGDEELLDFIKISVEKMKEQKKAGAAGRMAYYAQGRDLKAAQEEAKRRGIGGAFEDLLIAAGKKGLDEKEEKEIQEVKDSITLLEKQVKKLRRAFLDIKKKYDNRARNTPEQKQLLDAAEMKYLESNIKLQRKKLQLLGIQQGVTIEDRPQVQAILEEARKSVERYITIRKDIPPEEKQAAINALMNTGNQEFESFKELFEKVESNFSEEAVSYDQEEEAVEPQPEAPKKHTPESNSKDTFRWKEKYEAQEKAKSGFSRAWEYVSQFRWLSTGNQVLVNEFKREEGEDGYNAQTILRAELDFSGFVNTITTFGKTFVQNRRAIEGVLHHRLDSILENFMRTIPGLKPNRKKHRGIAYDMLVDNLESRGFGPPDLILQSKEGHIPSKYKNIKGIEEAYDIALAAILAHEAEKAAIIQRVNENYSAPAWHTLTQRKVSQNKVIASKEKFIKLLMQNKAVYLNSNLSLGTRKELRNQVKMTRAQAEREYAAIIDAPSGYDYQDWADTELLSKKPIGLKRRIDFSNPAFKDFWEENSYIAVKHRHTETAHYVSDMEAFGFGGQALHSRIQGINEQLIDYYRQKGASVEEAEEMAERWMPRISERIFNQYISHRGEYHKLKDKNLRHLASNIGSMLSLAFMSLATFSSFAEGGLVFRNVVGINEDDEKKFSKATMKMALYTKQAAIAHMKKFVDLEGDWANTEYREKMFQQQVKRGLTTHDMGAGHVIDAAYDDDKQNFLQREIMPRYYNFIGLTPLTTWMRILRDTASVEEIGAYMMDAMTAYQMRAKLMKRGNKDNGNQPMSAADAAEFFGSSDMTQKEARAWMAMTQLGGSPMEVLGLYDKIQRAYVKEMYVDGDYKYKSQMSNPMFHDWLEAKMKQGGNSDITRFMEHLDIMRSNFVDASLVNPDPGKRPPVYSDGRMRLLFLFQGYLATFSAQIARPILRDLAGKGAPKDQINAAGVTLTMMALAFLGLAFKDEIKYGDRPSWLSDAQYVQRGVQASGIMGQTERVFNLMFPLYTSESDTLADKAWAEFGAASGAVDALLKGTSHAMTGEEELAWNQFLKIAPFGVVTRGRQGAASLFAGDE